jgi:thiosulfate dehydrogenase [quinone] large subunit
MIINAAQGLALTRMGFGLYFLASAWEKTTNRDWLSSGEPLRQSVQRQLPDAEGFYRPFLEDTVLPNADTFAELVVLGEWFVGVSLLLGLFTRIGALTGMWLMLNYMLMKGLPNIAGSIDRLFFLTCAVFVVCSAGLVWGLDGLLQRQRVADDPVGRLVTGGGYTPRRPALEGR